MKKREQNRVQGFRRGTSFRGFTIIELLVVIAVVAILATIAIVSYNGWRGSVMASQVKSDLSQAAAAMQSAVTFNDTYPDEIPDTFNASEGVDVVLSEYSDTTFCIDGSPSENPTITFYIDQSFTGGSEPQEGTCATRPADEPPEAPTNVIIANVSSTMITMNWTAPEGIVSGYILQCALDSGFIYDLKQSSSGGTSGSISGTSATTTYYCRVRAENSAGNSPWSAMVATDTNNAYGSLAVGTSIEGYWQQAPQGFLLEDGSEVSRTVYADLFAVIGTTFGAGDGSTTFNLPDSRGRTSVNMSSESEFNTLGETGGAKTHTLTISELPSHTHAMDTPRWLGADSLTGGTMYAEPSNTYARRPDRPLTSTGSDQAHNNIQPSITKNFAIKYSPIDASQPSLPAGVSISGYWQSIPSDYIEENGAAISRSTYADLFSAIGTTYGAGNGSTTFNLPDSRGRVSVNQSSESEFNSMGETGGAKTHQLTIAEMPNHNHTISTPRWLGADVLGGSTIYAEPSNTLPRREDRPTSSTGGDEPHNNLQPYIAKKYAIKYTPASGSGNAVAVGTSVQSYSSTTPSGYLPEDGAAVSRTTYSDLFSAIGTTYGAGNGSTTFNLPDSRGRIAVHKNPSDSQFDVLGEKYGEKTHLLTIAEMPSHNHTMDTPRWYAADSLSGGTMYAETSNTTLHRQNRPTTYVGGDQPHNNLQPYIVKRYYIKY